MSNFIQKLSNTAKDVINWINDTKKGIIEGGLNAIGIEIPEETKEKYKQAQDMLQPEIITKEEESQAETPEKGIQDGTAENQITEIGGTGTEDIKKWIEDAQKAQWEREDAIRKETQEREDTAYQRAIADARKAGINPNLIGINPASSGGGITQATGLNYAPYQSEINEELQKLEQILDQEFKADENQKDRIGTIISSILMALLLKK